MSNIWFRVHHDIINDPKIRILAFEDRWHYVAICCLKSSGELDKDYGGDLRDRFIAIQLGISKQDLDHIKKRLIEVSLIDDEWQPLGWEKRQFLSDIKDPTAAERQKRYRENKKIEDSNGSVTEALRQSNDQIQITDTNTDTNTDKPKGDFFLPVEVSESVWADFVQHRKEINKPLTPLSKVKSANILKDLSHDQQRACVDKSISSRWAGLFPDKHAVKKSKSDAAMDEWLNESNTIDGECTHVKQ